MLRRRILISQAAVIGVVMASSHAIRFAPRNAFCEVSPATPLFTCRRAQSSSSVALPCVAFGGRQLPPSPHRCSVEQVLLPDIVSPGSSSGIRTESLRGMVQLLLDPDAADVEDVSMLDFVVMVPRRQLAALRGRKEWLDVVLSSERYQACKDARALRLAGITTVGRWDENRERVPVSAYSRGILEEAYSAMARQPIESQKDQVITWLTKTIQKAVIEEFAANKSNRQILMPLITGMQALPETAEAATNAAEEAKSQSNTNLDDGEREETVSHAVKPKGRGKKNAKQADPTETHAAPIHNSTVNAAAADTVAVKSAATSGAGATQIDEDEDAEIDRLLKETEQEFAPAPYIRGSTDPSSKNNDNSHTLDTHASKNTDAAYDALAAKSGKKKKGNKNGKKDEESVPVSTDTNSNSGNATNVKTGNPASTDPANKSLTRLAELMLRQFNSADGYLHSNDEKLADDEQKGFVVGVDDGETYQVEPFALYSAFTAAKVGANDSVVLRALKQVWTAYNTYSEAEDTGDAATAKFNTEKGVEALVHGAVLLRAISREHQITLEPQDIQNYGFPLLSSDRRPFRATKRNKGATDMTSDKVNEAVKAYTAYFANREKKFTPIRPAIDSNSGCSVAALMGTTLHLYETSLKETVQEEDLRCRFAEAMLGVLHVTEHKVITRVNVVHYHILATSISGGGSNGLDCPTTSIVNIDTTGPFTTAEKTRLAQLAAPLGMADSVSEFTCVSDIIDAIEELGVSVVHDLLTNRDDLEALLTPTLVQMLPEADDDEDVDEEAESKPVRRGGTSDVAKNAKAGSAGKTAAAAAAAAVDHDDDDDDEVEDEKHTKNRKQKSPAPLKKAVSMDTDEEDEEDEEEDKDDQGDNEEEEAEEEEEEEEEEEVKPSPPSSNKKGAPPTKPRQPLARATQSAEVDEDDDDDDEDDEEEAVKAPPAVKKSAVNAKRRAPVPPPPPPPAARGNDEDDEEEAEAKEAPPPVKKLPRRSPPPPPTAARGGSNDDEDEREEQDAEEPPRRAPLAKKPNGGKRAVPAARGSHYEDEDEEDSAAPPPPPQQQHQHQQQNQQQNARAQRSRRKMSRAPTPRAEDEEDDDEDRWFKAKR